MYSEEDYLQLSGIQHFSFCRRQWALIHIEDLWVDNHLTTDGKLMHRKAHDAEFRESRKDLVITRGVNVFSSKLGVSGQCDVLEFHKCTAGISLRDKEGLWIPYPVEYKRGSPRDDNSDKLQLCGQAICLEEMLCCDIPEGALYYGELHQRVKVKFSTELRDIVCKCLNEMHDLYKRGYTPKVKPSKSCVVCSLKDVCLPELIRKQTVSEYLSEFIKEGL